MKIPGDIIFKGIWQEGLKSKAVHLAGNRVLEFEIPSGWRPFRHPLTSKYLNDRIFQMVLCFDSLVDS